MVLVARERTLKVCEDPEDHVSHTECEGQYWVNPDCGHQKDKYGETWNNIHDIYKQKIHLNYTCNIFPVSIVRNKKIAPGQTVSTL